MRRERRREARYPEIGHISCSQICALPGVLEDISASGCRAHFPNPVFTEEEQEYAVRLTFSRQGIVHGLELVCIPQWKKESGSETEIGFKILRSPDSPLLSSFIESLQKQSNDSPDVTDMIIPPDAEFIK